MASEKLINSLISEIRAQGTKLDVGLSAQSAVLDSGLSAHDTRLRALGARLDAFNARMDSSLAGLRWMFGGMLALLAIGLTAIGILISAI